MMQAVSDFPFVAARTRMPCISAIIIVSRCDRVEQGCLYLNYAAMHLIYYRFFILLLEILNCSLLRKFLTDLINMISSA